jgi:hypothetical protein
VQAGRAGRLPAATTDDEFIAAAQRLADRRGEAVAVCQGGRLVCVINPKKR